MPLTPYFDAYNTLYQAVETGQGARQHADWLNQRSDEIAKCMKQAGFNPPRAPLAETPKSAAADYRAEVRGDFLGVPRLPDTLEETRRWGYGVESQESGPQEDDPYAPNPDEMEADAVLQAYLDSLSESQLKAYWMTLSGWDMTEEGAGGDVGGCQALADEKHPEPAPDDRVSRAWDAYLDLTSGMTYLTDFAVPLDPQVRALDRAWAACMLGKGHEIDTSNADEGERTGHSAWRLPTLALIRAMDTGADGTILDPATYHDPEADVPNDQRYLVGSQPEIDVAVADFECREETDYMDTLVARLRAMQNEFLAENQAALDAFLADVSDLDL
jgi:hypothetical protein